MRYSMMVAVFALLLMGCSGGTTPAATPEATPAVSQPAAAPAPVAPAVAPAAATADMRQYKCSVCGHIYDPATNNNVPFSALPADWKCPRCHAAKEKFAPVG